MATLRRLGEQVQPRGAACGRASSTGSTAVVRGGIGRPVYSAAAAAAHEAGLERRAQVLREERDCRESASLSAAAQTAEALYGERRARSRERHLQQRLFSALAEDTRCNVRETADRRLACDANPELRALQRRIEDRRATQRQAIQVLEKEVRQEEERFMEAELAGNMQMQHLKEREAELKRELQRRARGAELRRDLQMQAVSAASAVAARSEQQKDEDRRLADAAHARACEEDAVALAKRREQQAQVKSTLDGMLEFRSAQAYDLRKRDTEEAQAIEEYWARSDARTRSFLEARRNAELNREATIQKLCKELSMCAHRADDYEKLRFALHQEEHEANQRRLDAEALARRYEARLAAARACEEDLRRLEERRRSAGEEEQLWRQSFLARLAEEDRLEQLSDQKRRQRQIEHRKQADQQLAERRRLREQEVAQEQRELELHRAQEQDRQAIIEEEMQRLLDEYAKLQVPLPCRVAAVGRPHSEGALRRQCWQKSF